MAKQKCIPIENVLDIISMATATHPTGHLITFKKSYMSYMLKGQTSRLLQDLEVSNVPQPSQLGRVVFALPGEGVLQRCCARAAATRTRCRSGRRTPAELWIGVPFGLSGNGLTRLQHKDDWNPQSTCAKLPNVLHSWEEEKKGHLPHARSTNTFASLLWGLQS